MTSTRLVSSRSMLLSLALLAAGGCAHARLATEPPPPAAAPRADAAPPAVVQAQALPDGEGAARELASRVTRVTVYSDRARVTREARVELAAEPAVFAFRGLPGWVDDGSVRVSASAGRILDVRVDRSFLARSSDAGWRRLEAEQRKLTDRQAALRDELGVLEAQRQQIEALKAFSTAKVNQDALLGNIQVSSYGELLRFIGDSLRQTAEARRAVQRQLDDLEPELQAGRRRLEDAKAMMQLEETVVLVSLAAPAPADCALELTYMLPGVTWEPLHELRASTRDAASVEVVSYAALSQTSGEDWGGAELIFSTQSTTKPVRIPVLEALVLGDTTTTTRVLTSQVSSFTRAEEAFKGQSGLWNKVHGDKSAERARESFESVFQSNLDYLQVVQGRTVKLFESLERRGTTAHFRAEPAVSVRGDGHPVRLRIGRQSLASRQRLVAAPEQSLNAARTLVMTNAAGQPLLPGRVALYQDGAFLGMTDLEFIAKGEEFALFLSVADELKLTRELDKKQSRLVRKTRSQMQVAFVVTVENLGAEEARLTLADRIPVSENKDIKIDRVAISPGARPDSKGLVHWELALGPGEKKELRISYQLEYPAELMIETSRRRAAKAAAPARPARRAPAGGATRYEFDDRMVAPSPAPAPAVEDQILDLEEQF